MLGGLRGALSRFFIADGLFLAAGLAFFFLICLIPLVLLGVSLVGFVLTTEEAAREVVGQLTRNLPVYRRDLSRVLFRIIEIRGISGILGTVILILFSTPLFSASRQVMHRLLGVKAGGSFVRNLAVDAFMVLLLGVLLFAATIVTWTFDWFRQTVPALLPVPPAWMEAGSVLFSVGLSGAMFYLGYRHLPRRRVGVGPALAGAALASLLWEVAKRLFALYIRNVGIYHLVYGPLGVLVAFVMFVYYSAVVFVLGAAYVAELETRGRGARRE